MKHLGNLKNGERTELQKPAANIMLPKKGVLKYSHITGSPAELCIGVNGLPAWMNC